MTFANSRSFLKVLDWLAPVVVRARLALASPSRLLSSEDRLAVEAEIHGAARLSNAYGFLLFSACGIAAIGLMQSSVAVVIGAMLISPLMGPIMSMGMALARVEPKEFKTAAVTLSIGATLAVLASTLIVWASPLKEITPEILGRTRPTLLDLAVALLSGFVGAYLTINRKGGAIAGVAIATALMPPLAVVGYGLATAAWPVAGGAALLFMTNVIAILGAVFGVARRYGFQPTARRGAAWEIPALFAVIGVLCIPLAFSLHGIVVEARETIRVRSAIEKTFDGGSPYISDLRVETKNGGASEVQGLVVTRKYVPNAGASIARQLESHPKVSVQQVVAAAGAPGPALAASALGGRPAAAPLNAGPEQRLRLMLAGAGQVLSIQQRSEGLFVSMLLVGEPSLADYQALEQAAGAFIPETQVRIVPPVLPFPEIAFTRGSSELGPEALGAIDTIAWALSRWEAGAALVEGEASPSRRGRRASDYRMASARAEAVATRLRALGVPEVTVAAIVPERLIDEEANHLAARVRMRSVPADGAATAVARP